MTEEQGRGSQTERSIANRFPPDELRRPVLVDREASAREREPPPTTGFVFFGEVVLSPLLIKHSLSYRHERKGGAEANRQACFPPPVRSCCAGGQFPCCAALLAAFIFKKKRRKSRLFTYLHRPFCCLESPDADKNGWCWFSCSPVLHEDNRMSLNPLRSHL